MSSRKHNLYLIVEEEGKCMSIIYREWLIPGEKKYWHPGLKSDNLYLQTLRDKITKNDERDFQGKSKYNWNEVKFKKISKESGK